MDQAFPQEHFGWRVWDETSFFLTSFHGILRPFVLYFLRSRSGRWWHPRQIAGRQGLGRVWN